MILLRALFDTSLKCLLILVLSLIFIIICVGGVQLIILLGEWLFSPHSAMKTGIIMLVLAFLTAFGMMTYEIYLELSDKEEG